MDYVLNFLHKCGSSCATQKWHVHGVPQFDLSFLDFPDDAPPKIVSLRVPALLFADIMLLISKTPTGLQALIDRFMYFCKIRGMDLNVSKPKYMTPTNHIEPH